MQILSSVDPTEATGQTKQIFDAFQKKLGVVPNLIRTLANSPAALKAYTSFNAALGEGKLPTQLREQIAIAVANANSCEYCLSAHHALGKLAGLTARDLDLAQTAEASSNKTATALNFAVEVVHERGQLGSTEVERLRAAGYGDGEIAEIIAVVAINIFTNYFNHITATDIDFPVIRAAAVR